MAPPIVAGPERTDGTDRPGGRSGDVAWFGSAFFAGDHGAGEVFAMTERGQHDAPHMNGDQQEHQVGKHLMHLSHGTFAAFASSAIFTAPVVFIGKITITIVVFGTRTALFEQAQ